jgi:hypothetical protein
MSTATVMVGVSLAGVSLVITLMMTAVVTRARHKRVLRQRDETPEDQYRRAAQDLQRMRADTRRDSDRKASWQSEPHGGSGV